MSGTEPLVTIECPACRQRLICDRQETVRRLSQLGMLRRSVKPEWQILVELIHQAAERMTCEACGSAGLLIHDGESENDWPSARKCEMCGTTISSERLEVFPQSVFCAACQTKAERGESTATPDYCPRCGDIMRIAKSNGAGVTRYSLRCPSCR